MEETVFSQRGSCNQESKYWEKLEQRSTEITLVIASAVLSQRSCISGMPDKRCRHPLPATATVTPSTGRATRASAPSRARHGTEEGPSCRSRQSRRKFRAAPLFSRRSRQGSSLAPQHSSSPWAPAAAAARPQGSRCRAASAAPGAAAPPGAAGTGRAWRQRWGARPARRGRRAPTGRAANCGAAPAALRTAERPRSRAARPAALETPSSHTPCPSACQVPTIGASLRTDPTGVLWSRAFPGELESGSRLVGGPLGRAVEPAGPSDGAPDQPVPHPAVAPRALRQTALVPPRTRPRRPRPPLRQAEAAPPRGPCPGPGVTRERAAAEAAGTRTHLPRRPAPAPRRRRRYPAPRRGARPAGGTMPAPPRRERPARPPSRRGRRPGARRERPCCGGCRGRTEPSRPPPPRNRHGARPRPAAIGGGASQPPGNPATRPGPPALGPPGLAAPGRGGQAASGHTPPYYLRPAPHVVGTALLPPLASEHGRHPAAALRLAPPPRNPAGLVKDGASAPAPTDVIWAHS